MTETPEKAIFEKLASLGIETKTAPHPAVFTVEESRELDFGIPGGHTKNLFLKAAKGRLFLIVAHSDTRVDLKRLPKRLGCARLSFGKPPLLQEVLGVEPGSVTAFAAMNDEKQRRVSVIVDEALMEHDLINCHPLVNTATTSIRRDDLLRFLRETGHEPEILRLEGEASSSP